MCNSSVTYGVTLNTAHLPGVFCLKKLSTISVTSFNCEFIPVTVNIFFHLVGLIPRLTLPKAIIAYRRNHMVVGLARSHQFHRRFFTASFAEKIKSEINARLELIFCRAGVVSLALFAELPGGNGTSMFALSLSCEDCISVIDLLAHFEDCCGN